MQPTFSGRQIAAFTDKLLFGSLKEEILDVYRWLGGMEGECSFRGKWTNDSCEKMFGPAQENGNLTENGSPRWKQRAFNDFFKDISYLVTNIPVVRLSFYDTIDYRGRKYTLGDLLEGNFTRSENAAVVIQEFINKRF